ncbi:MAG: beta-aspartyl-peptidase [Bacteriovorax sp.]|nr:beta-aspartyl-peptidase [Bacteriovorax sp.]
MASVLLLKNAEVYSPSFLGKKDILCLEGKVAKIGSVNSSHLDGLEIPYDVLDLEGMFLLPGLLDPHEHLIGGSGEAGYASRSPEMTVPEIVRGGITTVVGCIGVDTFTRNIHSLLAQAKFFNEEGLTAYIWSGGYSVPPPTLTGSIKSDLILVNEVIGAGEIAISDVRSSQPTLPEIARIVSQAYVGGMLTGKAGVTHFHLGEGKYHLQPLFDLLANYDVNATSLYPTHINRNPQLLKEGAAITHSGVTIDFDTCDGDLIPSLKSFIEHEGDLNFLTLSSDASFTSPSFLFEQIKEAMKVFKWSLEKILPLVTTNTARILQLRTKGYIGPGADADLVAVDRTTLEIIHVVAKGKLFIKDGKSVYNQRILESSNRKIEIYGKKK